LQPQLLTDRQHVPVVLERCERASECDEDIRVNYGDPVTGQTGRLFLPFDFMVGRKLTQNLVLSLEVSVPIIKDYPVYDFKTEVRLNMLF
jgi:hypothetical protein